ncbi:glycosyltransferase family 2 protein [Pseudarthrobacter sp. N5]|uniref:glycosyltransferase family 2 protein n=1 Tax=Pseudarthrobacter sp. N5 TaxID=3418416 RepID=UPI003CFB22C3
MSAVIEPPTVSVVICSYTVERWDLLMDVIDSVHAQTFAPEQVIVVVDHNEDLYKRLIAAARGVTLVESIGPRGLSGARNTGVSRVTSDIVAFLDDDAEAAPDWLERLTALYDDPDVLAVGGRVEPVWETGRPAHFGEELDWIVGCSHRGLPRVASEVRNVIGANMSFRLDVLQRVGGFNLALGRQGTRPLGCEETEICIRSTMGAPGSRIVYEPAALVRHHVPAHRGTLRYMLARSWSEGISKAQVSHVVGHKRALGPERRYVRSVLPRAVFSGIRDWSRGTNPDGLGRAGAVVAVLAFTAAGYLRGRRLAHVSMPRPRFDTLPGQYNSPIRAVKGSPVSERASEMLPAAEGSVLELVPVMESRTLPDWSGARWIGTIDYLSLNGHTHVRLQNSRGYGRARLLVREGSSVRGFVDVEAPDGIIDRRVLDTAAAALPAATSSPPVSSTPPITVILCTRDRASLLREALGAILRLDYPNFDVLVVDNAAQNTDTSDMVRQEFQDSRVTLIQEPVPGLSQARNTGLRHARGDIVAFTDDDVVVDKAWLREIAAGFERAPDAACVTGLVPAGEVRSRAQGYFDDRVSWSKSVAPMVYSLAAPPADLPRFPFCVGAYGTGANFALDRRTALSLGGFDTALGAGTRTGGGEDIDMFTRVILEGYSLVVQPSAIVWHRHRDGLEELRAQARSYGSGLGAWLTKILLNPHTARLALARSPHAVRHFLPNARRRTARPAAAGTGAVDPRDPQLAKVLRLELISVARGPLNYLLQRLSGESRSE